MNEKLEQTRHSLSHVLAMAVLEYDPDVKMAIGPVIDTGFYYDFEFSVGKTPGEADLQKLEKEMKNILKRGFSPKCKEINEEEAKKLLTDQRDLLDRFANELLAREELEYDDIEAIVQDYDDGKLAGAAASAIPKKT